MELKRCMAGAVILDVVVGKLRHRKKPCPIILLKVNEVLKVGFYRTILLLSLAARLWIKDSG